VTVVVADCGFRIATASDVTADRMHPIKGWRGSMGYCGHFALGIHLPSPTWSQCFAA
jgi:hypothetical protein